MHGEETNAVLRTLIQTGSVKVFILEREVLLIKSKIGWIIRRLMYSWKN